MNLLFFDNAKQPDFPRHCGFCNPPCLIAQLGCRSPARLIRIIDIGKGLAAFALSTRLRPTMRNFTSAQRLHCCSEKRSSKTKHRARNHTACDGFTARKRNDAERRYVEPRHYTLDHCTYCRHFGFWGNCGNRGRHREDRIRCRTGTVRRFIPDAWPARRIWPRTLAGRWFLFPLRSLRQSLVKRKYMGKR